ncbi:septin-4 isoform X9 [Cebus imitator]|uniref:septin-4 isoform X9 n=1 Tax=Cebus imitator TaxID=2715852 RepID=UPI00189A2F13|nr:septin-4 isoform X9 [Cebus imitator]
MGSTQKGTIYQTVKTNKPGAKVSVSAQRGSEVTTNTFPQRGHGYILTSSHRSAAVSLNPSHRRSEAAHPITPHSATDYPRSVSPELGPGRYAVPTPQGTETRPRTESSRHSSPHRKSQQTQTVASHASSRQRNISPPREEATRRGGESKSGRKVSHHASSIPDVKSSRRLSFQDQRDNLQSQILQDDPPSKVQNPQGVRVPRRILSYPKDEAVQTEPIQRIMTTTEIRSPRSPSLPEHRSSSVSADYKTLELTPRPLPPRSLPRYGPGSSWWALLNPEVETPQSRPTTPDFEPKCSPSLDPLLSGFKIDSSPLCEDLKFQREKASPSPPPSPKKSPSWAPLSEVPQTPKHACKQPIQRFSAFFLDVSEEMCNHVIWWLKGLCFFLLWAYCGSLGYGRIGKEWHLCMYRAGSFRR